MCAWAVAPLRRDSSTRRARRPPGCSRRSARSRATTLLIYPLRDVAPPVSVGVVYLVAVLLVSTYWGLVPGLLTGLASAVAFNFFHIPPTGGISIADSSHWVALGVYLVAAAIASRVADRRAHARRRRPSGAAARPIWPRTRRASCWAARRSPTRCPPPGELIGDGARAARRRARPRSRGRRRPARRRAGSRRRAPRRRSSSAPTPTARCSRASRARRPGARSAAAGGARARRAAGRRRRDAGPAPLGRHQDRAAARGLARPAHAADGDHHRRPRRCARRR